MKNTSTIRNSFFVQKTGFVHLQNGYSFSYLRNFLVLFFVFISGSGFGQGATCATATSITVNGTCSNGSINNNSEDAPLISTATCSATFNREGWYTFTITTGPVDIMITGTTTNRNLYLQLISSSASCAGLATIACANNINSDSGQTESIVANLSNGIYYVKVVNVGSNGSMNLSSLCVSTTLSTIYTSGSSITVPSGVCSMDVECWGAGGGGARVTGNPSTGGGGSGGGYVKASFTGVAGNTYSYSLGAGGSGTTSGSKNGTSTWFNNNTTLLAVGGNGATNQTSNNVFSNGATAPSSGNIGGTLINTYGGNGGNGIDATNDSSGGGGSSGGSTASGNGLDMTGGVAPTDGYAGANGRNDNGIGTNGNIGAGGSGGRANSSTDRDGGAGGNGQIRITYHINPTTAPTAISSTENAICLGESSTLTATGGSLGCYGASTLWFAASTCPTIGFMQEFRTMPYATQQTSGISISGGILSVTSYNIAPPMADAQILMEDVLVTPIDPSVQRYISFRYRITAGTGIAADIYFKRAGTGGALSEDKRVEGTLISDGNWHIVSFDMGSNSYWTNSGSQGNITGWRFDYTRGQNVTMQIDYIILASHPVLENSSADDGIITVSPTATTTYYATRMEDSALARVTSCASTTVYIGKTWTGAVDNNWTTAGNWIPLGMPSSTQCVQASSGTITVNGNGNAKNLTLTGTANLNITYPNTLTVQDIVNTAATSGTFTIQDSASLLQINGATNTGNITAIRNAKPMKRYDYTYWSSPVAGQTLHDLSPITLFDKYFSWNPAGSWSAHNYGAATMQAGKGYIVRAPQSFPINSTNNFIGTFIGTPNNGEITVPGFQGSTTTEVWNLIGNPYPSAISVDLFLTDVDNSEVGGTVYLWTHNSPPEEGDTGEYTYTANDYASYNLSGGVATALAATDAIDPGDNSNTLTNGYIASGQAFFVKGIKQYEDLDAPLTNPIRVKFKNGMRIANNNGNFFKPGPTTPVENWETTGKHRFWINLRNEQGAFNQSLIGYVENATDGLDRLYDGALFGGNYVTIYSLLNQNKLSIQGKALPFNNEDVVPLGYKVTIAGTFNISLDHFDGLFEAQDVFLKDNLLNVIHNLKDSAYSFTSAIGTFDNRFTIVYQNETLGTENPVINPESILVYKSKKSAITVNAGTYLLDDVKIYDVAGRLLSQVRNVNSSETVIQNLPDTQQVLIVDVLTVEGHKVAKKIVF